MDKDVLVDFVSDRLLSAAKTSPLVAAQPGIWMAEQLSAKRNPYVVAQYVELNGRLDIGWLGTAIRLRLAEADLIHARFVETDDWRTQIVPARPGAVELPELEFADLETPLSLGRDAHYRLDLR
jgi:L-arginine---[L-arginyl-carrier protein] ligase